MPIRFSTARLAPPRVAADFLFVCQVGVVFARGSRAQLPSALVRLHVGKVKLHLFIAQLGFAARACRGLAKRTRELLKQTARAELCSISFCQGFCAPLERSCAVLSSVLVDCSPKREAKTPPAGRMQ